MKDYLFPARQGYASMAWMPPVKPLDMPIQDFSRSHRDPKAPLKPAQPFIWAKRVAVFVPALICTIVLAMLFRDTVPADGSPMKNAAWIATITVTFFWISFVLCLSAAGLITMMRRRVAVIKPKFTPPLKVAILMPVYNEDVSEVFANVLTMQDDLNETPNLHRFSAFVLSDSQDPKIIAQEHRAFTHARATHALSDQLYYRRRENNQDFKTGNLRQWVTNWGAHYDAMLVLDADSLMSAQAVLRLTNTLAQNPHLGVVQGALRIFRGRSLIARWQQFAGVAFGAFFARGLALWSGDEGNFFGHNAIVRTRAFAACSGLPAMPSREDVHIPILSHDFVEAALMRRAGWGIRILPDLEDSYEGTPETLIDFIRRDRRWCQGNMQHLRIMSSAGFHLISRHHLLHNALTYLMSPAWLALILFWTAHGFTTTEPNSSANFLIFGVIYAMLLAPKIAGAIVILASKSKLRTFGGVANFAKSFAVEIVVSFLIAPIMMIHQTIGVGRSIFRLPPHWGTPVRQGEKHSLKTLIQFHVIEIVLGFVLASGIALGSLSIWLSPIAFSLALAPVISHFSRFDLKGRPSNVITLDTILDQEKPEILSAADVHRRTFEKLLRSPLVYDASIKLKRPAFRQKPVEKRA